MKHSSNVLGNPRLSSTGTVSVVLQDENDNTPQFDQSPYTFYIKENNDANVVIASLTATDQDIGRNGLMR